MSKFIEERKAVYKRLKPCYCPTLQETVYFTADGLNHILYKRRRPRKHAERHYRATLIPYLTTVIENATVATKRLMSKKPLIVTWELKYTCTVKGSKMDVKVIVKKKGTGKVSFLSVMAKKHGPANKKSRKKS